MFSSTHLKKEVLEVQHNTDRAHNFIYTYEENADSLDLLFSSIDDPAQTMESILSYIGENPNFQGLTWDSFLDEIGEFTKKGHGKG